MVALVAELRIIVEWKNRRMTLLKHWSRLVVLGSIVTTATASRAEPSVHVTYHWHLHQPLYWPAPNLSGQHVQSALDSIELKARGLGFYPQSPVQHPENMLADGDIGAYDPVFTKEDRVRIYQERGLRSLETVRHLPDAGAQVTYSGSLIDNIRAFGLAERYGYRRDWAEGYKTARQWKTTGGKPRLDLVGITYHHGLGPLLPKAVLRKELAIHRATTSQTFGASVTSDGFFPAELAFAEEMIPELVEAGYKWTFVSASHLARSTANFLAVAPSPSTGTWNTDPPNNADMINPAQPAEQWWSGSLDGRGAILPVPFAYHPHYATYTNPISGVKDRIIVVPADDVQGYMDGYGSMGTATIDRFVAPFSKSERPALVVLAHDGDNAWGGGYSYYMESVPQFSQAAEQRGYHMTTVSEYLARYPVPSSDLVHVESGSWVNPDGDFGGPAFAKWLFPPQRSPKDSSYDARNPRTFVDIEHGFSTTMRSWAVIAAGANLCETAEQIQGPSTVRIREIFSPEAPNLAEKCWHYYLAGLDSGFMYYGASLDDEVKQSVALIAAAPAAEAVIGDASRDGTPPSMIRIQRWPHNPGGKGWGMTTRWQPVGFNGGAPYDKDFHVWTLAYDVSGVKRANLFIRAAKDGRKVPNEDHTTYKGGPSVTGWTRLDMRGRAIDPSFRGDPPASDLNYFVLPPKIADVYSAKVTGYAQVLLDYYVEIEDQKGNLAQSEIGHVWVD